MTQQYPQQDPNRPFIPPFPEGGHPPIAPKKKHTARNVVLAVIGGFVLLVGGCSALVGGTLSQVDSDKDKITTTTPAVETTAPASSEPSAATEETTEPEPTKETSEPVVDTVAIGKTLTYETGLSVSVVSAKTFSPSYASGLTRGHKAVKVAITLANNTGETIDLEFTRVALTFGADGAVAETVYADGVGGEYPFDGSLANGKKKTAYAAFSVPKAGLSSITVEVVPDDAVSAFFAGKVATK